ncbi:MAG: hypothetical protein H6907_13235 [Hyphomicrobiales bacterium]|nr:hypothetical protein [Hyphomicrobiales bacterium]MCP5372689.1 hypothetical protein [Hyphomicrobiales bacterium]
MGAKVAIKKLSGRGAMGLLVVFSVLGWLAVGFLFSVFSPNDSAKMAGDSETRELQQFSPAAGPQKGEPAAKPGAVKAD